MGFKHQFYANFTPATRMLPKEMDMGFFPKLFLAPDADRIETQIGAEKFTNM